MKVALLGASRGCGLAALHLLLAHTDWQLFVLLRDPSVLDSYDFSPSRVTVFQGDALSPTSISAFLTLCGPDLTYVLSSIGGKPIFDPLRPLAPLRFPKGQENICFDAMNVLLIELEKRNGDQRPKIVVVSSNAIGRSTHGRLPWLLKPLYGRLLKLAHADKERMEILLHRSFNWVSPDFNPSPSASTCTTSPMSSTFRPSDLCILRPSLLTDGASRGRDAIRASSPRPRPNPHSMENGEDEDESLPSAWTISRADVGLFLVNDVLGVDVSEGKKAKNVKQQRSQRDKDNDGCFGRGIVISY